MSDDNERRMLLVANGHVLASTSETHAHELVEGRALVRATLTADVVVQIDTGAVAAIHARSSFGFKHLRALIDALPRCKRCLRVATWVAIEETDAAPCGQVVLFCDDHEPAGTRNEAPFAPAVRHIEKYVTRWEQTGEVPRLEP